MSSKFGKVAITRTRTNTAALAKVQCPQCNKWRQPYGKEDTGLCTDCEETQAAQVVVEEAPVVEEPSSASVEAVQVVSEPSQTQETAIHEIITGMQAQFEGKPSQDVLHLLLQEEQEEGPHNDGLLASYIREAHDTLSYLVQVLSEERLYKKVLRGETVHVQVASTGKAFTIRTAENNTTGLPAYDIFSPSGKIEKRGIILDKTALRNWIYGLVEVD